MTPMKRRPAIAVTAGVWVLAVGLAAALTYDLNRPFHWVGTMLLRVLYMPTSSFVGHVPRHPVVARVPKASAIPDMSCADWRVLDMGTGRVQVCV